jgi:hypothetical protein
LKVFNACILLVKIGVTRNAKTLLTGELLIGTKSFGVFWSFGENSMRLYRDGRQISNRQEEVQKRGGLKIK